MLNYGVRRTIDRQAFQLVQLRLSNHKLMIETGLHGETPQDKRLCPVCHSNEIEDEIHFLRYCPKYLRANVGKYRESQISSKNSHFG